MDKLIEKETSEGKIIEVFPVGIRIQHRRHKDLTGIIHAHEYTVCGKISPLPYLVHWDDNDKALIILGWFNMYPYLGDIVSIEGGE